MLFEGTIFLACGIFGALCAIVHFSYGTFVDFSGRRAKPKCELIIKDMRRILGLLAVMTFIVHIAVVFATVK